MMRARAAWLSMFLLLGACGDRCAGGACSFDPLARAKIHMSGRVGDFDKVVDEFAARKGVIVGRANFPLGDRDDRWVDNIEIDVDKTRKSFLVIDNFKTVDTMEAAAYSHEHLEKWKGLWDDFLATATAAFGPQNVEMIKADERPALPSSETKPQPGNAR